MSFFNKFSKSPPKDPLHQELQDIINNLNHILNTKKEYGSVLKDYGIRDMNEYTSREDIAQAVVAEVKRNIETYEPRLELIKILIENSNDPFNLSFKVECNIRQNVKSLRMVFDAVMNNISVE